MSEPTYNHEYTDPPAESIVDPSPGAGVAMIVAAVVIAVILGLIHHYSPWMF